MKQWHLYLMVAICLLLIGGLIDHLLFVKPYNQQTSTLVTVDTIFVYKWKEPKVLYDTIIKNLFDTIYITPTTPLESIPVRDKTFQGKIPLRVNKQELDVNYEGKITYRGILYNFSLRTFPETFFLSQDRKREFPIKPYLAFEGGKIFPSTQNYQFYILSELGLNIDLGSKVDVKIFGKGGFWNKDIVPILGAKIEIK